MLFNQKRLAITLAALILIGCVSFVIVLIIRERNAKMNASPAGSTVLDDSGLHIYTDDALRFSIEIPPRVTDIQKMGQGIVFGESSDGPWIIGVATELISYRTTKDWLNAQPVGGAASAGYEFVRWIGQEMDGKALVAQYVGPGDNGEYGKRLLMITVKNESLYTLDIDPWHNADEALTLPPDIERALETFRAMGLVTTDSTGSYRTIQNWPCDATLHIPPDWTDQGILGSSKILSPEDKHINEEWERTHQEAIQNAQGDAILGPDARSLYLSCQYNSISNDLKSKALKTMNINGVDAYEVADTIQMPDGTSNTNYTIVLEGPKIMTIHLGRIAYDDLSDTVKGIINSISFKK